jgi:hypothetical protein
MTTFSQLVDEMVIETRRPDLRSEIATYLNQTVREVHFEPSRGNVVFFSENRKEYEVTASTADSGQTWDTPNPAIFQGMEAVQFPNACAGRLEYAKERRPGPGLLSEPYFYYRAGITYVFGGTIGYGGVGSKIRLSYFEYPSSLKYKADASRPATYDVEAGWSYFTVDSVDYDADDDARELARSLVTNWLILRWADVLREGLRAKIYKRLSDQLRAQTSYSLYSQLRQGLFTSEAAELQGG